MKTLWIVALFAATAAAQQSAPPLSGASTAPSYTADSIVNGATQTAGPLAPNTIATLYGSNLAFSTEAAGPTNTGGGSLPVTLAGVGVWINGQPCYLYLVSPTQINFLVPSQISAGAATLLVSRQSATGPTVTVQLNSTAPGFFQWNGNNIVAAHLNGQVISSTSPATAGEIVIAFANGLGRTSPDATAGQLATVAAWVVNASAMQVLFDGVSAPAGSILYAGLAPGYAGLYQINLRIPPSVKPNPQVQIQIAGQTSPGGIQLPVQKP